MRILSHTTYVVSKRIKLENEVFTCLDDCINNNFNYESIRSCLVSQDKNKNRVENNNSEDLIPIVFGTIVHNVRRNADDKSLAKTNEIFLRFLLDSGASSSIIHSSYVRKGEFRKNDVAHEWSTMAGTFKTTC